jgi:ATP/maltotriose-dependent transcriptional regulator MalT
MINRESMLIKTKLLQPHVTTKLVLRQRFLDRFESAIDCRLISVSAPAGYGKTTALSQVAKSLAKRHKVGWLSLDSRDNQESLFLQYFVACLQSIDDGLCKNLHQQIAGINLPSLSDSIASVLNEIVDFESHIFIFLDDFHFIQSSKIKDFIEVLVNLAPTNFHLVLSSRLRPQFPIITKNAHADTLVLSTPELRFDLDEVRLFIEMQGQKTSNEKELLGLLERSEGWVVGLQLLVLYLGKESNSSIESLSTVGGLRDVADYLFNQVLVNQSEQVVNFLLRTSILQRFNAQVCDYVLKTNDATELLDDFEALNLFLVPLDEVGEWFRYHHFFQEFLQAQLSNQFLSLKKELYLAAATWFRENGMSHEAVEYALEGELYDLAVTLIGELAIAEFMRGNMPRVNEWIDQVPHTLKMQQPKLLLIQGTSLYHMNKSDDANLIVRLLRDSNQDLTSNNMGFNGIEDEIKVLEAGILMSCDHFEKVPALISHDLNVSNKFTRGSAHNILGYAHYRLANYDVALSEFDMATLAHTRAEAVFGVVYSVCFKALVYIAKGALNLAENEMDYLKRFEPESGEQPRNVASVVDIMRGVLAFEFSRWGESQKLLEFSLPRLEKVGHVHLLLMGYSSLVKIRLQHKDYRAALTLLDSMALIVGRNVCEHNKNFVDGLKIEVLLARGKLADAFNLATLMRVPLDDDAIEMPDKWDESAYLKAVIAVRILIGASQYEAALSLIPALREYLKHHEQGKCYYELLWLNIVTQFVSGDLNGAVKTMYELTERLAPQSMFSPILCGSGPVREILEYFCRVPELTSEIVCNDYIGKCLDFLQNDLLDHTSQKVSLSVVEKLSARELAILEQMALGKSNARIAEELFISEGTVKWHCGNIYGKLSVKNRTAAVISAIELGIIN